MKRFLSLVLSLTMLMSVVPSFVSFADDKVIFSDSFEKGMDNWQYLSNASNDNNATVTTKQASDGKNSVYVKDDSADNIFGFKTDYIPAKAGVTYTVSGDVYNENGSAGSPYLNFFDSDKKKIGSKGASSKVAGKWTAVSASMVAPEGTEYLQVLITGGVAATGESYVDNIKLTEGAAVVVAPSATPSTPSTPAAAPSADGAIFFDDFEGGLDKWTLTSKNDGGNTSLSTTKAANGKNSVYVKDTDSSNIFGLKSDYIPAKPGVTYTVSGDVYNEEGAGGYPYVNFFDSAKKKLGGKGASTSATGAWKSVSASITSPAGTAFLQVLVTGGVAATGSSYVDNVKLVEGGTAPAPSTSSSSANPTTEPRVYPVPEKAKDGDLIFADDFENGWGLWKYSGKGAGAQFSLSGEYFSQGKTSLKGYNAAPLENATAFITQKYPIEPSSTYTLIVDTINASGSFAKPIIRLFDANNKRIQNVNGAVKGKVWEQNAVTFTTPKEAVQFEIYISASAGAVGEFYMDNLRLYKGKVEDKADFSKAKSPDPKELDFVFKSPYEMPEFKPTIGHPRVYFNKNDIERIKANATHPQNASAYKQLLKEVSSTSDGKLKSATGNNLNMATMGVMQAKAFYYAIWGDETRGKEAVSMLNNFLENANPFESEYNAQGYLVFTIAAVYDWCYPLLTDADKKLFQNKGMEAGSTMESGFPPTKGSVLNGHSAEAMILRDQMAFAIAVYDERPDIYQAIAGRYFKESVPSVKFLADAKSSSFGNSYMTYRHQWEVISAFMMETLGIHHIFGENHKDVMRWLLYARRPDGSSIHDGDSVSNNQNIGAYDERGTRTFFLAGNYYKDPYLKGEALRHNNGIIISENSSNQTLSSVEVLCFNDPSVEYKSVKELPLSMYYPAPRGEMIARTSWDEGVNAPSVVAQMKIDEYWTQGHDHLDSGEFEIYYKGALANDTGYYQAGREGSNKENSGNTVYGTVHFYNYHRRTIAHNCMVVFDPNENVSTSYNGYSNDGGQLYANGEKALASALAITEANHVAKVLGQEIGTDTIQPDYTYLKGDLAKAYGEKVPEYERSFMFLNLKNSETPAAMIVFDRVKSKDASFDKKWLLHGLNEPEINGTRTVFKDTRDGYNGKLTVDTLLPKADNVTITPVGGAEAEYMVDGVNYWAQTLAGKYNEGGGYRIEVSPKADAEEDYFLNVLQVADADSQAEPLKSEMIESATHTGVKVADRVVMFGKLRDRVSSEVSFAVTGDGWFKYSVADLKEGTWQVKKDGNPLCEIVATKDGGIGSFEASTGTFTLTYLGEYGEKAFTSTPNPWTEGINLKLEPANKYIYSDVDPFTVNGRTLVPLRAIFEALEADVTWDEATATATGVKDGITIKITENKDIAYVNGNEYKLDAPAMIKDGRFVVPVRFIAESFGITVDWDDFSKSVIFRLNGPANTNFFKGEFISKHDIPNALPIYSIEQSGDDGAGDNIPLAFDNIMTTNWAVKEDSDGNPGWGIFDLGSVKTIDSISTAYMRGSERVYTFSIYVSEDGKNYTLVKENLKSSGTGPQLETHDLGGVKGRFVKYVGYGNTSNSWNSITEIVISGK